MSMPEITQRDLRSRSREIMDAVARGESFTVSRDGHQIGELIPVRRRRTSVSRQEFAAMSRNTPVSDLDAFRGDQDATSEQEESDPYERWNIGSFPAGTARHQHPRTAPLDRPR